MHPKDEEGLANSVDPDQTAPLGAVWSGSTLFAQTCLSENLGTLRYRWVDKHQNIQRLAVRFFIIRATARQNQQSLIMVFAVCMKGWFPSYPCQNQQSLFIVFVVCMKGWVLSYPLSAQRRSDQTGLTPRLVWVFEGHTGHFVSFVVLWLI